MAGHVFFMDCLQNNLREVYCFEFQSADVDMGQDWDEGSMFTAYGADYWESFKREVSVATKLKLVIPMPIADSSFKVGASFPRMTIYRRPAAQPSQGTNDYASFEGMKVTWKRTSPGRTFQMPPDVQSKVRRDFTGSDGRMSVPTIVVLSKPAR